MKSYLKELWQRVKQSDLTDLAAVLAYYFLLSLFPLLLFLLTLLPLLDIEADGVIGFIREFAPGETGQLLEEQIRGLLSSPNGGLLSFGILATIWSASNATNAAIRSLNKAHMVEEDRPFWKVRLMAIIITIGLVGAMIVALVLPIFGEVILRGIETVIPVSELNRILLNASRWIISIFSMSLALAILYRLAPNTDLKWKDVWVGAVTATVLWQIASLAFSFYVSEFGNYQATYGSIGAIIVLMLWLYITGLIILIGGEINAIRYCRRTGDACLPQENEKSLKA
ncbi:YihY/virulence factor BrkB family protein [Metabacillus lacus]|uniref:YihY/virulence factor BrkB family protein n=1 Tax=Metabacillus lacus TaxID=1983721 RepID=UPI001FE5FD99|nr:YihY/virulence factor BrkB family protein [Metabacillus lacus]